MAIGYDSGQQQIDAINSGVRPAPSPRTRSASAPSASDAAIDAIAARRCEKNIDTGYYWFDKTNINNPEIQAVLYK